MAVNVHLQQQFSNIAVQKKLHGKILIAMPHFWTLPFIRPRAGSGNLYFHKLPSITSKRTSNQNVRHRA